MFSHVRPTEVWLKCHTSHYLLLHIISFKWKITQKRKWGRGGGGGGGGGVEGGDRTKWKINIFPSKFCEK